MKLLLDAHVHLYPFHDAGRALRIAARQLHAAAGADAYGLLLAERSDCAWFRELIRAEFDGQLGHGIALKASQEDEAVELTLDGTDKLWIFAGRQVATRERLELLALTKDLTIPDGLDAGNAIRRILDAGGVPALCWGIGKWLGARGALVKSLLERWHSEGLILCDSALRPPPWPAPAVFAAAQRLGIPVLAGTDPLPLTDEEKRIGRYASLIELEFDHANPATSLRAALARRPAAARRVGRRCSPLAVGLRTLRLRIQSPQIPKKEGT